MNRSVNPLWLSLLPPTGATVKQGLKITHAGNGIRNKT
jgi:hypothetical protein